MSRSSFAVLAALLFASPIAAADPIAIEVDARELPRKLIHTTLDIPCKPGPLKLWYPKWFPGSHGPHGRVQDVAGFRVEASNGKVLPWSRDDVELNCFLVKVPDGASAVRVKLDTICESVGSDRAGTLTVGTRDLGVINWNTCLVYPQGPAAEDQMMNLRLKLPDGWRHASALKSESKGGAIEFKPVSLTTLIDSPLIAGKQSKSFKLDTAGGTPAWFHVVSESSTAVNLEPRIVELYAKVVREAHSLFGVAHYPEYHFLVVCSDELGTFGLEHLACSLNGVGERGLADDRIRKGWWIANLLPHEYAHSWCGKYRRPAGMVTADLHTPQKTRLLWVYEGLTEYLGEVLSVRAGIVTPDEYKNTFLDHLRGLTRTTGRTWRSLEDTSVAGHLFRNPGRSWNQLRRGQDFYMEGKMLWYECDAIIRSRTNGAKSLDDFCKRFFAAVPGKSTVAGFEFADVVKDLKATADFDWEAFLRRRVELPMEELPLDVLEQLGYRLKYSDQPPVGGVRGPVPRDNPAGDSLGITIAEGSVLSVDPGFPADKAGLAPGMNVIGVNGRKFSLNRLRDAIADSVTKKKVELLVEDGEDFRTISIPYSDGLRYLDLERLSGKPDVLVEILKPRTK